MFGAQIPDSSPFHLQVYGLVQTAVGLGIQGSSPNCTGLSAPTWYYQESSSAAGPWSTGALFPNSWVSGSTWAFSGLTPNSTLYFQVYENGTGTCPAYVIPPFRVTTPPVPWLSIESVTMSDVVLGVHDSASFVGPLVHVGYFATELSGPNPGPWARVPEGLIGNNTTVLSFRGLSPGTEYTLQVNSSIGNAEYSPALQIGPINSTPITFWTASQPSLLPGPLASLGVAGGILFLVLVVAGGIAVAVTAAVLIRRRRRL